MPRKKNRAECVPEIIIDDEVTKKATEKIGKAKEAKGLTIEEITDRTGISTGTIHSILKDKVKDTRVENLLLLAKLFDLSLDDLFNIESKNNDDPIKDTMLSLVKIIDSGVIPPLELKCEKISEHEREYSVGFHFRKCIDASGEYFSEEYPIYRSIYDFLSDYLDLTERLKGNDMLSKKDILNLCLNKHSANS